MNLFDDPNTVSIDRAALDAMRQEAITIAASAANVQERANALRAQVEALLGPSVETAIDKPKTHVIKMLLSRFDQEFQKRFNDPAPINGGKDAKTMQRLLANRTPERISELITAFFESTDPFIVNSGYTIGVFASQIGKLVVSEAGPAKVHGFTPRTSDNGRHAAMGADLIRSTLGARNEPGPRR